MAWFTDVDLWYLIEHDDVLKGYVGGAFADFCKLDDGVLLGYGSQGKPRGGLLLRIADVSTVGLIRVKAKWVGGAIGQSSTIPTSGGEATVVSRLYCIAALEEWNAEGMSVADLCEWLRDAAAEVACNNYPAMGGLACDVCDALKDRDGREWEDGVHPDGVAWFRAADGEEHYVSIQEPGCVPRCYASMWVNVDDDAVEVSSYEEAVREVVGAIA